MSVLARKAATEVGKTAASSFNRLCELIHYIFANSFVIQRFEEDKCSAKGHGVVRGGVWGPPRVPCCMPPLQNPSHLSYLPISPIRLSRPSPSLPALFQYFRVRPYSTAFFDLSSPSLHLPLPPTDVAAGSVLAGTSAFAVYKGNTHLYEESESTPTWYVETPAETLKGPKAAPVVIPLGKVRARTSLPVPSCS